MFNKKTVYISAALILAGFIGVSAASAQSPTPVHHCKPSRQLFYCHQLWR
jgi:hypothetical protein